MALVEVRNIHKRFGANHVLNGVSLDIDEGEIVTIIGRSGSGKSTLLRCLNALENVDDGEIRVGGEHVHAAMPGLRQFRQRVGIVFQQFNLFPHLNVERNITLALVLNGRIGKAAGPRAGAGRAAPRRTGREDRRLARPVVGRPAAARGHRPLPGDGAGADAVRRSHVGAGPRAGGRSAQGHGRHGAPGHDDGAGHARDGLRAQRRVQGRVHAPGPRLGARPAAELFAHPRTPELRQFIGTAASAVH